MTGLWLVSYVALWILFLVIAVTLLSVLRNLGVVYDSLVTSKKLSPAPTKLVAGEGLPELTLQTLGGDRILLSKFRGIKTAFVVVDPDCSPCLEVLKEFAGNGINPDPLDPSVQHWVVISVGDTPGTIRMVDQVGFRQDQPIFIDMENFLVQEWGIKSTPATVIVDEQLRVVRQIFGSSSRTA